jgi:DNA-binding transcriptional LysR family regulator
MELMQLEMFLAVVEERSVNRAAERVCRTQPAVSIALRKLEQEFGQALLHRPRRGTYRLTPAGELMYELAIQMVGLRDEAVFALRGAVLSMPSRVAIGIDSADIAAKLLPILSRFRRENPGVRVELFLDTANRLLSDLADRKIDLFLASRAVGDRRQNAAHVCVPVNLGKGGQLCMLRAKGFGCETVRKLAKAIDPNLEKTEEMCNEIRQRKMMNSSVA